MMIHLYADIPYVINAERRLNQTGRTTPNKNHINIMYLWVQRTLLADFSVINMDL